MCEFSFMKKYVLLLVLLFVTSSAWSQPIPIKKGVWSCGLLLQSGTRRPFSIGASVQYVPVDKIRADLNASYYFALNYDLNLNLHYLIDLHHERFYVYPLVGFTAANMTYDSEENNHYPRQHHVGLNLGGGIEYLLDYDLSLMFELRHAYMKVIGHTTAAAGVRLKF